MRARLRRRWYLGVVGVLTTIVLCAAAMMLVPVKYTAKADIILTPPPITTGSNPSPNPYLALGGMRPLGVVVARAMTNGPAMAKLQAKGLMGTYAVDVDPTTDSPIVDVTTTGASAASAMHDLRLVLSTAAPLLVQLQDAQSVPVKMRVAAQVIAVPTAASATRKSQIRALAVALVVGVVGTALVVTWLDSFLLRRRRRRGDKRAVASDDEPTAPDADDSRPAPAAAHAAAHGTRSNRPAVIGLAGRTNRVPQEDQPLARELQSRGSGESGR